MRRTLHLALALVAGLLATAAPAHALDQFGQRGLLAPSGLGTVAGIAAARDGQSAYVLDAGDALGATDDCGAHYTPMTLHRITVGGVDTVGPTIDTDLNVLGAGAVPMAVAPTPGGDRLLVLVEDGLDTDGDGACTPPASPVDVVELDAATFAVDRRLTAAGLGGTPVRGLSVVPTGPGATSAATVLLQQDDPYTPGTLTRWPGLPGVGTPAAGAAEALPPPTDPNCTNFIGTYSTIAAEPGGTVLITGCDLVRIPADLSTGTAVAVPPSIGAAPGDLEVAADGTISLLQGLPALGEDGLLLHPRVGIAQLAPDGTLRRAWGDTDNGSHADCAFGPGQYGIRVQPYFAVAGARTFVASVESRYNESSAIVDPGPRLSWFGPGAITPRCLVRPRPAVRVAVDPASAVPGQAVAVDASASDPGLTGPNDDNFIAQVQWRPGTADFEAPSAPTDLRRTLRFDRPGTYPIDVRIVDAYGDAGVHRIDYVVRGPAPTAVVRADVSAPAVDQSVVFDASGSTGVLRRYEFDLDGNGSFEHDNGTSPTLVHRFLTPGPVTVGVRVTNDGGQTAIGGVRVDVRTPGPPPPPAAPVDVPAAADPPVAGPASTPAGVPRARVTEAAVTRATADGHVAVRVSCAASGPTCRGSLALDAGTRTAGPARTFLIAAGRSALVTLRLDARARAALRHAGRLAVVTRTVLRHDDGRTTVARRHVTLRRGSR